MIILVEVVIMTVHQDIIDTNNSGFAITNQYKLYVWILTQLVVICGNIDFTSFHLMICF